MSQSSAYYFHIAQDCGGTQLFNNQQHKHSLVVIFAHQTIANQLTISNFAATTKAIPSFYKW